MKHLRTFKPYPKNIIAACRSTDCAAHVLNTGQVVGVCSDRDCDLIRNLSEHKVYPITLPNGDITIVDYQDKSLVQSHSWSLNRYGHVRTNYGGKEIYLARLLMDSPAFIVDHRSGNKLDNRRSNLRLATSAQNAQNRKKRDRSSSAYIGVYWHKGRGQWHARIRSKQAKIRNLGFFDDEHDAAEAFNKAAKEIYGDFANLNEINRDYRVAFTKADDEAKQLLEEV